MGRVRWEDVHEDWDPDDGTLRDILVSPTSVEDWDRVRELVDSKGWSSSYSENGRETPMPSDIRVIVGRKAESNVLWRIQPVAGLWIHCQFWELEEMEFDVSVHEVVGQEEFDVVCEFVSCIGQILQKPVAVTIESGHDNPIMRYDPASDEFVRVPPDT